MSSGLGDELRDEAERARWMATEEHPEDPREARAEAMEYAAGLVDEREAARLAGSAQGKGQDAALVLRWAARTQARHLPVQAALKRLAVDAATTPGASRASGSFAPRGDDLEVRDNWVPPPLRRGDTSE